MGADHRGFELKKYLKGILVEAGYTVNDVGAAAYDESDDYPAFARALAERVSVDYERSRGILICGSGIGVSVVANKYPNIRAALVLSPDQAFDSRNDEDSNVLCISADYTEPEVARQTMLTWLKTPFSGEERFRRRLQEVSEVETDIAEALRDEMAERKAALRNEPPPPGPHDPMGQGPEPKRLSW